MSELFQIDLNICIKMGLALKKNGSDSISPIAGGIREIPLFLKGINPKLNLSATGFRTVLLRRLSPAPKLLLYGDYYKFCLKIRLIISEVV